MARAQDEDAPAILLFWLFWIALVITVGMYLKGDDEAKPLLTEQAQQVAEPKKANATLTAETEN